MSYKKKVRLCAKQRNFSLLLPLLVTSLMAQSNKSMDATMIPLEELVNTKFIPASTIANQISNASSAVSVVTSKEIKEYGYRTLGEILASMRGLHVMPYYAYTMLGGRGFPNRDYSGRIIVLIDGYRADDSYFGQAYLGNDGILDVALIERVEYIPGGGSAGYGDGAIIGVINVITKKGSDIGGSQVAFGYGSQHAHQQRVTVGDKLDNGANILLSASSFGAKNSVIEENDNEEKNKRFFAKYDSENFSFMGAYVKRDLYMSAFSQNSDENTFGLLKYHTDIASNVKLSTSLWAGQYVNGYAQHLPATSDEYGKNTAKWYGGDIKLIGSWFDNHTLSLGTSYRNDYEWRWDYSFIDFIDSSNTYIDNQKLHPRKTYSLYTYDDFTVLPSLSLNYGLRYENSDNGLSYVSPRASVIWKPVDTTVLKLSAGKSNRQATPDEEIQSNKVYTKPEQTKTVELALEQQLDSQTKLVGSLYQYRMSNRINTSYTPNLLVRGAEIELYKHWDEGILLRTSYAKQNAETTDHLQLGSPSQIAKLNVSAPIFNQQLRIGTEVQYIDKFPLYAGANEYIGSSTIVNLNLLAQKIAPHLDVNFLVHDMFSKSDKEIATYLPQSGRTLWLQLEYTFK